MKRRSTIRTHVALVLACTASALPARAEKPCGPTPVVSPDFHDNDDFKRGNAALAAQDYDEAVTRFKKLIVTNACSVQPLKLLAVAEAAGGYKDAAVATYRQMLTIVPIANPNLEGTPKEKERENARLLPLWRSALRDAESQLAVLDPPLPARARVVISVKPADAVVTLGGNVVSVGTGLDLAPGELPLRVAAPGFRPHVEELHAVAGKEATVNVVLERYVAGACRDVEPYDAGTGAKPEENPCNPEVLLTVAEGQLSSGTPAEADATLQRIAAVTFGQEPADVAGRWRKAQASAALLRQELVAKTQLLVHVEPGDANAKVAIDLGSVPRDENVPVAAGSHKIRVTAPGYEAVDMDVSVDLAERKPVTVRLERGAGDPLHVAGKAALWAGSVAAVAGISFGIAAAFEAHHASNEASLCPGHECTPDGVSYMERTRTHARLATTLVAIGVPLAVAGGLLCVFTAYSEGPAQNDASLVMRGTF